MDRKSDSDNSILAGLKSKENDSHFTNDHYQPARVAPGSDPAAAKTAAQAMGLGQEDMQYRDIMRYNIAQKINLPRQVQPEFGQAAENRAATSGGCDTK